MGTTFLPSVSVMGVMGPLGLMNVQVAAQMLPRGVAQFGNISEHLLGNERYRMIMRTSDRSAADAMERLAGRMFATEGTLAVSDSEALDLGVAALAAAERDAKGYVHEDEGVAVEGAIPGWVTSLSVYGGVQGDPNLSLLVLQATRDDAAAVALQAKESSPSIAAQKQAAAVLQGGRTLYADVMKGHEDGYVRLWGSAEEMFAAHKDAFTIVRSNRHDPNPMFVRGPGNGLSKAMDDLVRNAVFNPNEDVRNLARWIIWEGSQRTGAVSSSIHNLYMARAKGEWSNMTVPAINIRGLTYDMARAIFRKLKEIDAAAAIFEIAKSEIGYTDQRPAEFAATVLAAAIREGWNRPVFLQGDHFQVAAKDYQKDPKAALQGVKDLIKEAVEAGFYNIDLDTSTLVDLSKGTVDEQQRANYEVAAELTAFIRSIQPEGITISVGGEIGEIGTENSTPEELRAFMDGYNRTLAGFGPGLTGLSKISIQTGTKHGGIPAADGKSTVEVKISLPVLQELGRIAREEYGLVGVVQHGASTLPDELFHLIREMGTGEIHLATGFQNGIYDSEAFPSALRETIYGTLADKARAEVEKAEKKGKEMTWGQAIYTVRKNGFGPFKRHIWSLRYAARLQIMEELGGKFEMLFRELNIGGSAGVVDRFIAPVDVARRFGGGAALAEIGQDNNPNAD